MSTGKKMQNTALNQMRKLNKDQLGGVIFGCTDSTMKECLSKQLFGLPGQHIQYVQNIDTGLPLFLFNYSDRTLHGIFEAVSPGQMNIDPYGWTTDGSERTSFPAQVQVRIQKSCRPLTEKQFKPIIQGNYFTQVRFRFELDHVQVSKLRSLFMTQEAAPSASKIQSTGNWKVLNTPPRKLQIGERNRIASPGVQIDSTPYVKSNEHQEVHLPLGDDARAVGSSVMDLMFETSQKVAVQSESDSNSARQVDKLSDTNPMCTQTNGSLERQVPQAENAKDNALTLTEYPFIIAQLMLEVQELRAFRQESLEKMGQLERMVQELQSEVKLSRGQDKTMPASLPNNTETYLHGTVMELCSEKCLDSDDAIFLVGGYDGKSWLASLESYCPSKDIIKSLCPMSSVHCYSSLSRLDGDIYVIGGGHGNLWYNTVECYSVVKNEWTSLACLNEKKGSLASITLHEKIYAMGGGNGVKCFSDVEMFDLDVGRWISARSMLQKRFALAAAELNGAVYAVGGFDGKDYLSSAERFDPREHSWSKLGSMNSKRGCHSMVVLNEKLDDKDVLEWFKENYDQLLVVYIPYWYAMGGFDGSSMVSSVEVYDPRMGTWMIDAPMNYQRGYAASVLLNKSIYAIGGLDGSNNLINKVECYEEGRGWQVTGLKAVGSRCFAAAIV